MSHAGRRFTHMRSTNAIRQGEHRQRTRADVRCYYVPVHSSVLEALIERGLSPEETLDGRKVGRELGDVLMQWAARWHREKNFP